MALKNNYGATKLACYLGYITQAVCLNLFPLFFVTFQKLYGVSYSELSLLIVMNIVIQIAIDLLTTRFYRYMNVRGFTIAAHVLTFCGLVLVTFLPEIMPPFPALLLCEALCGFGGGLTEVMISPIIEACPAKNKGAQMSFLHAFYCWGAAAVIGVSSICFAFFDVVKVWRYIPLFWALIPLTATVLFAVVPIDTLDEDEPEKTTQKSPVRLYVAFILLMLGAGATELVMSQWASSFAETCLGVSKEVGDLLGPGVFAVCMGSARLLSSAVISKIGTRRLLIVGCFVCTGAYLLTAFSPLPALAFVGCALCGFGVGAFWPSTLSLSRETLPHGGVGTFALLAFAGDLGCILGPSMAGVVADLTSLKVSFAAAIVFPLANLVVLLTLKRIRN